MVFDKQYIQENVTEQIKREWEAASQEWPGFLKIISAEEKREAQCRFEAYGERLGRQMEAFPRFGRKKRWKKAVFSLLHEVIQTEPLMDIKSLFSQAGFVSFEEEAMELARRIRRFDSELGFEEIGQALRNYLVYAVLAELNGLPQRCTNAIFGYSMLYPVTDNFIDAPTRSEEEKEHYNQVIADFLMCQEVQPVSDAEEKTVQLLKAVGEDYGDTAEEAFAGLLLMLDAQRKSLIQSDKTAALTKEQILKISVYKGGMSVLLDRYFLSKPMTERDMHFYYGLGFLLQLCDDLQDIEQDTKAGSRTLFSSCQNKEEAAGTVNKALWFAQSLFTYCDGEKEEFKHFLQQNLYLLLLVSGAGSFRYMTGEWLLKAEECLPVSLDYLKRFDRGFEIKEEKKKDKKRYRKMMDVLIEKEY